MSIICSWKADYPLQWIGDKITSNEYASYAKRMIGFRIHLETDSNFSKKAEFARTVYMDAIDKYKS